MMKIEITAKIDYQETVASLQNWTKEGVQSTV